MSRLYTYVGKYVRGENNLNQQRAQTKITKISATGIGTYYISFMFVKEMKPKLENTHGKQRFLKSDGVSLEKN